MRTNTRDLQIQGPIHLRGTLAPAGKGRDPAKPLADGALWRAWRTPGGPATLRIERTDQGVRGEAWGPGADHALDALPALVGADDEPAAFAPDHPLLREVQRRNPGIRFGRTDQPVESLIRAIPAQRVTGADAAATARDLSRRFGEPAPGPAGLRLPPDPERIAVLSYAELHEAGLERSRATTMLEVCRRANRINALGTRPPEEAMEALQSIRGIGPWTANRVAEVAWGFTDAVEVGDYWLPSLVTFAFTGEPRGDDERMLELLEPYRPHRARVIRLLMLADLQLPRFGPRTATRNFRDS